MLAAGVKKLPCVETGEQCDRFGSVKWMEGSVRNNVRWRVLVLLLIIVLAVVALRSVVIEQQRAARYADCISYGVWSGSECMVLAGRAW